MIREALAHYAPDPADGIGVLSAVGGLDLAGLAGVCIGGAMYHVPVVLDGVITAAAALAAQTICPGVSDYLLASHVSAEPAGRLILERLGLTAAIDGHLCLGEGTGAMAFMPLLDMALEIYEKMSTFEDIHIAVSQVNIFDHADEQKQELERQTNVLYRNRRKRQWKIRICRVAGYFQ